MTSRSLLNIGLLLLLALLVVVVIYEPGKEPPPTTPALTQLKSDAIHTVRITRQGQPDIVLQKQTDGWWLKQPFVLPANAFRVQSLLRLVNTDSLSRHELSGLDNSDFGLDTPRASITFNNTLTIHFGNNAPLNQRRYVGIGTTLHLITDTFYYQLAGKPTLFAAASLLPPGSKITRLVLPELRLELKDGQWQFEPATLQLNADAITGLIDAWLHSQALELSQVESKSLKPVISISLQDQEQALPFAMRLEKDELLLIRTDLGIQYKLSRDSGEQLLKPRTVDTNTQ